MWVKVEYPLSLSVGLHLKAPHWRLLMGQKWGPPSIAHSELCAPLDRAGQQGPSLQHPHSVLILFIVSKDDDAEPALSPKVQGDEVGCDVTVREGRKAGAPQESRKAAAVQSQPLSSHG